MGCFNALQQYVTSYLLHPCVHHINPRFRRGIDSRLVIFPDENHWVLKPENRWVTPKFSYFARRFTLTFCVFASAWCGTMRFSAGLPSIPPASWRGQILQRDHNGVIVDNCKVVIITKLPSIFRNEKIVYHIKQVRRHRSLDYPSESVAHERLFDYLIFSDCEQCRVISTPKRGLKYR